MKLFKVLTYGNCLVDARLLSKGIYSTESPPLHNLDMTIEKYEEQIRDVDYKLQTTRNEVFFENLRKCDFEVVELRFLNQIELDNLKNED